jgi:Flp pilus assembly pilin Flp
MGWQLHTSDTERGVTIVEYAVLMSLLDLGLIPVVGLMTDAAGDAHDKSVSHFSTTASSYSEGGGGGGAGETTTTTTTRSRVSGSPARIHIFGS